MPRNDELTVTQRFELIARIVHETDRAYRDAVGHPNRLGPWEDAPPAVRVEAVDVVEEAISLREYIIDTHRMLTHEVALTAAVALGLVDPNDVEANR